MPAWLSFVLDEVAKLPIEKWLSRPPDRSKELAELRDIMKGSQPVVSKPVISQPQPEPTQKHISFTDKEITEVSPPKIHLKEPEVAASNQQTVDYQNREIGKLLLRMERHLAQRMRINNVPCDCGAPKHLLDLEGMTEESIPMVDNPGVYRRILEWIKQVGPLTTVTAVQSGKHEEDYLHYSKIARDLRKDLLGSLDAEALFPSLKEEVIPPEPIEAIPAEV